MLVHATALLREPLPLDPIHAQNRTVRREARPDARDDVLSRKSQQLDEALPIGLFCQDRRARFGSGHYQGIERRGEQILERPVATLDVRQSLR